MTLQALLVAAALASPADEVVARVGARAITASEVAARAAKGGAQAALEGLIGEALLAAEGRRAGLDKLPEVRAAFEAEQRRLADEAFSARELSGSPPGDDQLRTAWHASSDGARLDLIAVASREEAEAALRRLRAGGSFAAEAQKSLERVSAMHAGDVGLRTRADLDPAIREAAFAAKLGDLQGPAQLKAGWAVFRVRERTAGTEQEFQAKKEQFRAMLAGQVRQQRREHVLRGLRAKTGAAVDEKFLQSTGASLDPGPEGARVVARAGEWRITYADVIATLRRTFGERIGGHMAGPVVKAQFASSLLDAVLLQREALSLGYGNDPAVLAAARHAEDEELARATVRKIRAQVPAPADAEIQAYFDANGARLAAPARACYHLAVAQREEAEELRSKLEHGADWVRLVQQKSLDRGSAPLAGSFGEVNDQLIAHLTNDLHEPDIAQALVRAQPGRIEGPVRTRKAWHLVKCDQAAAKRPRLPELRASIAATLAQARGDEAVRRRIAELRTAQVEVDEGALARVAAQAQ